MPEQIPLGQKEGPRLEFKAAAALRTPERIGREIVGMLNAHGGDVWIGLEEKDGVADKVGGVAEPDRAQRALLDHLIETIEPAPRDEITIEQVRDAEGNCVLRVRAKPVRRDGWPYAYRLRDGRYFGVRVADRLRTMSRHEIFANSNDTSAAEKRWRDGASDVAKRLDEARSSSRPMLWLCLRPLGSMNLTLGPALDGLFWDPVKTNNRPNGWTFVDQRARPQKKGSRIIHGDPNGRYTEVHRGGLILFSAPLDFLFWKGPERLIWPYIMIEFAVSIFKLASRLYAETPLEDDRVATQMSLLSARGWHLKAGSARSVRWQFDEPSTLQENEATTELRMQQRDHIVTAPDGCAYPLIQDIYEEFGLERDDLPPEFDPVTGLELAA